MQLTRSADYLLRILYYLASCGTEALARRQDIVAATDVPDGLFPRLAGQLRRAGLIATTQGARGGYRLAVPPEQITLLDAIEVGMGEMALNECVLRPASCHRSPTCVIHRALDGASQRMRESLQAVTLADLVRQDACLREAVGERLAGEVP